MWIDSHCHLDFPALRSDLPNIISQAHHAGVETMITISTVPESMTTLIRIVQQFPCVYATVGVHPDSCQERTPRELEDFLQQFGTKEKIVGVGETGLDFLKPLTSAEKEQQIRSFIAHIRFAKANDLPLVVHTRHAEEETVNILKDHGPVRGVFHCFTGTPWLLAQACDLDFFISISGIVTFRNATDLQNLVKDIPLNRLLLETDAPYLAPHPHRGKKNHPALLVHTAQKVALLKGVLEKELAQHTKDNTLNLFTKIKLERGENVVNVGA